MGKLPLYKIHSTPPFQNVSVDLVDYFLVEPTFNSKAHDTIWVLRYLCDFSNALHTEIGESIVSTSINNAFRS